MVVSVVVADIVVAAAAVERGTKKRWETGA